MVRVLVDAGADVKAEDDAGATPLDRVPAARDRVKGDKTKEAALQELHQMLTMAVLALSLPFAKSLPLHLGIEVGIYLSNARHLTHRTPIKLHTTTHQTHLSNPLFLPPL